jgi:PAS domain S-box-containing protein
MNLHGHSNGTSPDQQINVLLIEDSSGDAALIRAYLQRNTSQVFNLTVANRVSSGMALLAGGNVDIVLLDLSLPDSEGLDSMSKLLEIAPTVPLLVLTGLDDDEVGLEAVTRGAQDYLVKGKIKGESLRRSLRYAIERKRTEDALRRANRAYRVLAGGNQAVARSSDEYELMDQICHLAVRTGGYRLAWVGYARDDEHKSVELVAWAGHGDAYIAQLNVTWSDSERGRGPAGTAIRTQQTVICKDVLNDPAFKPWQIDAQTHGYKSLLSLPLSDGRRVFAVLTVYAEEPDAFNDQEIALLEELSIEIAQRVIALRERAERQRAELALRESEERFRRLIEQSPDIIFRYQIQPHRELDYISPVASKILGYPAEVLYEHLPNQMAAVLHPPMTPAGTVDIVQVEAQDGRPVWLEMRQVPIYDEQGELVAVEGIAQDVTERKLAEDAEREQRALAEALTSTAAALSSTLDLDEVMKRILDSVGRVAPHDAATIMLIEGDEVRLAYWRGYPDDDLKPFETVRFPISLSPFRSMIETRQPLLIPDTAEESEWVRLPETSYIRSYVAVPILTQNRVIGFLGLDSRTPCFFTPVHAERLQAFANQVAIASENAQLYDQIRRYSAELEQRVAQRTLDLSMRNAAIEKLSRTLDIGQMLNSVIQIILDNMPVRGAGLYLVNEEQTSLDLVAYDGLPRDALLDATGIPTGARYAGWVEALPRPDAQPDAPIPAIGGPEPDALSIPFWQRSQIQGVLSVVHEDALPWQEGELRMFDAIARQIGIAVSNARSYQAAVRGEAQIRAILHNVADGLLVFDHSGELLLMNPAAEALFEFYPRSLGGPRHVSSILWQWLRGEAKNGDLPPSIEFIMPAGGLNGEEVHEAVYECEVRQCPNYSDDKSMPCWLFVPNQPFGAIERTCPIYRRVPRRAVRSHIAEVRDDTGQFLGTVIGMHDVTYYRDLEELKNQFVSTVSHEMRTPLSTVVLEIGTLLAYYDRLTDAERREMLQQIQEQSHVLRDLIEDILGVSRLDAHREHPNKQRFDLAARCRMLTAVLRSEIQQKQLRVELEGCGSAFEVNADIDQIERVFRNLMSNAIKYTRPGGEIVVRLARSSHEAHLSISDTGIGIPPEDQLYVFDRFYRADQAALMAHGTGLGLSICKELIELHGGRMELQSEPDKGSTFTIHLPLN